MTQPSNWPHWKEVVAGSECEYVRDVDALAEWVLDDDQWDDAPPQCDRIQQGVHDSEWITWYWRQSKVLEHTQHMEAYTDVFGFRGTSFVRPDGQLAERGALEPCFDSVQSALQEFARCAMEADVQEAVERLEGAMDQPTSGTKSNFPEGLSDDQDRDDPDQFGRLTESELNEDPDLDPMEVV